jgi:hypothetical protein
MANEAACLNGSVETAMPRPVVEMPEDIPMSGARAIAVQYDLQRLSDRDARGVSGWGDHHG